MMPATRSVMLMVTNRRENDSCQNETNMLSPVVDTYFNIRKRRASDFASCRARASGLEVRDERGCE